MPDTREQKRTRIAAQQLMANPNVLNQITRHLNPSNTGWTLGFPNTYASFKRVEKERARRQNANNARNRAAMMQENLTGYLKKLQYLGQYNGRRRWNEAWSNANLANVPPKYTSLMDAVDRSLTFVDGIRSVCQRIRTQQKLKVKPELWHSRWIDEFFVPKVRTYLQQRARRFPQWRVDGNTSIRVSLLSFSIHVDVDWEGRTLHWWMTGGDFNNTLEFFVPLFEKRPITKTEVIVWMYNEDATFGAFMYVLSRLKRRGFTKMSLEQGSEMVAMFLRHKLNITF